MRPPNCILRWLFQYNISEDIYFTERGVYLFAFCFLLSDPIPWLIIFIQDVHSFVKVCDICLDAMSWIYNPLNLKFTNGPPTHYHFNEFILNQMPLSELWSYRYLFLTILFCQSFCPWGFMLVISYITRGHAYSSKM